jgi:hypothetical protein
MSRGLAAGSYHDSRPACISRFGVARTLLLAVLGTRHVGPTADGRGSTSPARPLFRGLQQVVVAADAECVHLVVLRAARADD